MRSRLAAVFRGAHGVRAGWRLLAFLTTTLVGGAILVGVGAGLGFWPANGAFWDPRRFLPIEAANLALVVLATVVAARLERRSLGGYGLPLRAGKGAFWEGLGWGAAASSGLVLLIWRLHGYVPGSFTLHGAQLLGAFIQWAVAFVALGFFEELSYRTYALATLRRSIGFWPAALVLSLLFAALHLTKDGETGADLLSVFLLGLFWCFTVRRTGAVWFAVGFHAAFDFFLLAVYAAPNGGEVLPGHLLGGHFVGPAWLTGGALGPEASLLVFPLLGLLFALVGLRYPEPQRPSHDGH